MHSSARRWLLVFAVLGLATSAVSAYVHYQLLQDSGYTSFCDVSATVSCSQAYLSRYGSFGGVSVAIFGVLFFALASLLAWVSLASRSEAGESAPGYLFVMSTIGLAVALYLAYAAFFVLKEVCLLCVGTYVAIVGLFLVSGNAMDYPMTTLPSRLGRDLRRLMTTPVALGIAVLFVAGAASALTFFPREEPGPAAAKEGATPATAGAAAGSEGQTQQSEFERWYLSQPTVDTGLPKDGAKVLIVKFTDYQCPACAQSHFDYKAILAKYEASHPGALKVVVKDYPLDPECNFNSPGGGHQASCEAAAAVRLASRGGKGEAMADWLSTNHATLTPESVKAAAARVGGVTDFDAQYPRVLKEIRSDVALGGAINVRATPTFVINGRLIPGALPTQFFDQALTLELKRVSGQ